MRHRPAHCGLIPAGQREPARCRPRFTGLWKARMNYWKRWIGDYARKTAHLSLAEHGAYALLLDHYYANESPLPADHGALFRLCRAFDKREQSAVASVADAFFPVGPDGLRHNVRADEEIPKGTREADASKANGKLGGRPKKPKKEPSENPAGFSQEPRTEPRKNLSHSHSHLEAKEVTFGDSSPAAEQPPTADLIGDPLPAGRACPHEAIIAAFHEALPTLPKVRQWTPNRRKAMQARWREDAERQTLEWWRGFFGYVAESDFLTGRSKRGNGHAAWECSLPWLLKAENFAKVLEGHYENREAA